MCCRVPVEPRALPVTPKVGCGRFPPVAEWRMINNMCENAQSPDDLAVCWDYVLTGLEAEVMDRNGILESSARKVYLGRAGPP
eukprot:2713749-Pyramimonas_sp.AAC.1